MCKKEWLAGTVLDSDAFESDEELELGGKTLKNFNVPQDRTQDLPVGPRTKVEDISTLKEGDQIAFHRPYVMWHHGIVDKVNKAKNDIEVRTPSTTRNHAFFCFSFYVFHA